MYLIEILNVLFSTNPFSVFFSPQNINEETYSLRKLSKEKYLILLQTDLAELNCCKLSFMHLLD